MLARGHVCLRLPASCESWSVIPQGSKASFAGIFLRTSVAAYVANEGEAHSLSFACLGALLSPFRKDYDHPNGVDLRDHAVLQERFPFR
jgi:hypothetical protein